MSKKLLAVVLSVVLAFSVIAVPASAVDVSEIVPDVSTVISGGGIEGFFYSFVENILNFVLKYLNMYFPGYEDKWESEEDYVSDNFLVGNETFTSENGTGWRVGYAGASLLEGIEPLSGDYYLAGSIDVLGRTPSKVLDDQRVRVYAISDGGAVTVQAVVDAFGLARGDVMEIRARMAEFAEEHNVQNINVSVLHQHSVIDTLGMNVNLIKALIVNPGNAATDGVIEHMKEQKSEVFMENLFQKTVYCMKKAVMNMKDGDLYYGNASLCEGYDSSMWLIKDKRDPQAFDKNIHRLRFIPEDGTAETWIVFGNAHCTMMGTTTDNLTADYPYYMERYIRQNSDTPVNLVYILGSDLAITTQKDFLNLPEDADRYTGMVAYGEALGQMLMDISNDEAVAPRFQIKMQEVTVPVDNEILTLACREDLISAVVVTADDGSFKLVTEIGYAEFGDNIAMFILPGEFDPLLVYGGPESGSEAWNGTEWTLPPFVDYTTGKDVFLVTGLCNDQGGYVIRDNEYHSLLSENEEVNIVCKTGGTEYTYAMQSLIESTVA